MASLIHSFSPSTFHSLFFRFFYLCKKRRRVLVLETAGLWSNRRWKKDRQDWETDNCYFTYSVSIHMPVSMKLNCFYGKLFSKMLSFFGCWWLKRDSSYVPLNTLTAWQNLLAPGCFILMYLQVPHILQFPHAKKVSRCIGVWTVSTSWFPHGGFLPHRWSNLFSE